MSKISCPKCKKTENIYTANDNALSFFCANCGSNFSQELPEKKLTVFMSYGHDQFIDLAKKISQDLRAHGHKVWFDEDVLMGGNDWVDYIEKGIELVHNAGTDGRFVLLMTPHSVRRPNGVCLNELAKALSMGIDVFPVMIQWCEVPLTINTRQWIEYRECFPWQDKKEIYNNNFERLHHALVNNELNFEDVQKNLFQVLNPIPFDTEILQHLLHFIGREWIVRKIERWMKQPNGDKVFWLKGGPGTGKTAISAWLAHFKLNQLKAYHFCSKSVSTHNDRLVNIKGDPKHLVMSIAYQLGEAFPKYRKFLTSQPIKKIAEDYDSDSTFDRLIVDGLKNIEHDDSVIILIDAVDEVTNGRENDIAAFINKHLNRTPSWLRFIITSREDAAIESAFEGIKDHWIDNTSTNNQTDLREYIINEIEPFSTDGKLSEYQITTLLDRSEGLFLYLSEFRRGLETADGDYKLNDPKTYPNGMTGIFNSLLAKKFADTTVFQQEVEPVLGFILSAKNPVSIQIATRSLAYSDQKRIDIENQLKGIFKFQSDAKETYVYPFHKSLIDYLTNEKVNRTHFVSLRDGHVRWIELGKQILDSFQSKQKMIETLSCREELYLEEYLYHLINADFDEYREFIVEFVTFVPLVNLFFSFSKYERVQNTYFVALNRLEEGGVKYTQVYNRLKENLEQFRDDELYVQYAYRLGKLFFQLERLDDAVVFYSLTEGSKYFDTLSDIDVAELENDFAETLVRLEKLDEAFQKYSASLEKRKQIYGMNHRDTAETINNIGHVYYYKEEYSKALEFYDQALSIRKNIWGEVHTKIMESYNNIAVVYSSLAEQQVLQGPGAIQQKTSGCMSNKSGSQPEEKHPNPVSKCLLLFDEPGANLNRAIDYSNRIIDLGNQLGYTTDRTYALFLRNSAQNLRRSVYYTLAEFQPNKNQYQLKKGCISQAELNSANSHYLKLLTNSFNVCRIYENELGSQKGRLVTQYIKNLATLVHEYYDISCNFPQWKNNDNCEQILSDIFEHYNSHSEFKDVQNVEITKSLIIATLLDEGNCDSIEVLIEELVQMLQNPCISQKTVMMALRILFKSAQRNKHTQDKKSCTLMLFRHIARHGEEIFDKFDQQLKGDLASIIAIAYNEFVFHFLVPECSWDEAEAMQLKVIEFSNESDLVDLEKQNLRVNLQRIYSRCGKPVDIEFVREMRAIFDDIGDDRLQKTDDILNRI